MDEKRMVVGWSEADELNEVVRGLCSILCATGVLDSFPFPPDSPPEREHWIALVLAKLDESHFRVYWKWGTDLRYSGANGTFAEDAGFSCWSEILGRSDFDCAWASSAPDIRDADRAIIGADAGTIDCAVERIDAKTPTNRHSIRVRLSLDNGDSGVLGAYERVTEDQVTDFRPGQHWVTPCATW